MSRHVRVTRRANSSAADSHRNGRSGGVAAAISARHRLLGDSWTADVHALESAIGRFRTGNLKHHCDVVCFEVPGDEHLHVNVTHRYATKTASGWAGPGTMPDGFVHNRRFGDTSQTDMIRHVRDMIFAAPV